MSKMSAGRAVVECLRNEGVKYIFGIVGSSFLDILDALYDRTDIRYLSVRHEQAAGFMAHGFARASGVPGVCLVTSGPGATNLVTGLTAAWASNTPVIAIAGGPDSEYYYRDAFQELDLVSIFRPITKASWQLSHPERAPELLRYAFRTALTGRAGPVFLEIPRDVLNNQTIDADIPPPESYRAIHRQPGDPELVSRAARLLGEAKRPVIIVGGGVTASGANDEVVRLAELLSIPLVTGYARNDAVPHDHPLYVGPLGRAGAPEAGELCARADVILAAGSRLGHFTTFYDDRYIKPGTRIIQVNIDPQEIGRHYPVAVGIQGDAKAVLEALLHTLQEAPPPPGGEGPWQREARDLRDKRLARLEEEGSLSAIPVKPQRVYHELAKALPRETIVTLDGGACPAFGYDRLRFSHPRTFFTALEAGAIGFAFAEALGAKLGRPDAPVLAIHGDGGYLFNSQELETAVREHIPVVTLVMNNNAWGSEKSFQRDQYGARYVGADLLNPRFDRYAETFGAKGLYVERPEEIGEAVREAFKAEAPSVIEVPVDPAEFPPPPRIFK